MEDQTRYGDIRDISLVLLDTEDSAADHGFEKSPRQDFDILLDFPDLAHLPGLRFDYSMFDMGELIADACWHLQFFPHTKEIGPGDIRCSLATRLRHYFTQVIHLIQRWGTALMTRVRFVTELNEVLRSELPHFWHYPRDLLEFHLVLIKIFLRARTAFLVKPVVKVIEAANTDVCMELTDIIDNLTITLQGRKIRFQGIQEADSKSIGMHQKARSFSHGDPKLTREEETESPRSVTGDTESSAIPTPATSTASSEDLDGVSRLEAESSGSSTGGDDDPKQMNLESQQDEQVEQPVTDSGGERPQLSKLLESLGRSHRELLFALQKQNAELQAKLLKRDGQLCECRVANGKLWEALREKENEELKKQGITGVEWNSGDMDAFMMVLGVRNMERENQLDD